MSSSKQLNFFIVPDDLPEIYDFLKQNDLLFIANPIRESDKFFSPQEFKIDSFQIYITKKEYQSQILFKELDGIRYLDIDRSYAIEFTHGGFIPNSNNILNRSRFYTVTSFFIENLKINKDDIFIKWVESFYKLFTKYFLLKTSFDKDFPFSNNALTWMNANKAIVTPSGMKAIPTI